MVRWLDKRVHSAWYSTSGCLWSSNPYGAPCGEMGLASKDLLRKPPCYSRFVLIDGALLNVGRQHQLLPYPTYLGTYLSREGK